MTGRGGYNWATLALGDIYTGVSVSSERVKYGYKIYEALAEKRRH
jgi:hypothetical protein